MRDMLTTIAEILGAAAVAVGVGFYSLGAGIITAGVAAVGLGYLGGRQ